MKLKVAKFGGSSLADAAHFRNAAQIIRSDSARKYVVVSAPGKRHNDDIKITDLLLESLVSDDKDQLIDIVAERFRSIISDLGLELSIQQDIIDMKKAARLGHRDFLVSRGEYISGKIMAKLLGYAFIDAKDAVLFVSQHQCDWEGTRKRLRSLLQAHERAVIPGFYGADLQGSICTFLRGGSDVTGSIVADAAGAELYENWTDVSGVLSADPRMIADPTPIEILTYEELHTFAHLGAEVIHEDAIAPCKRSGIPICIKNSNHPQEKGTMIVPASHHGASFHPVGVGLKKDLCEIVIPCSSEVRNARQNILHELYAAGLPIEHISTSEQCITVMTTRDSIIHHEKALAQICSRQTKGCYVIKHNRALVGTIGKIPPHTSALRNDIAVLLKRAGISADLLEKGYQDSCMIACVDQTDCLRAVHSLYDGLIQHCAISV